MSVVNFILLVIMYNFIQSPKMSLYIPHVFAFMSSDRIKHVVENYLGKVSRIDIVPKYSLDGNFYNSVYIHMAEWYDTQTVANFQERVLDPYKQAKIVYNDPYFWIVLENKSIYTNPLKRKFTLDVNNGCKTPDQDANDSNKEAAQQQQTPCKPVKKSLTNKDFSDLYKVKKQLFPSFESVAEEELFMDKVEELMDEDDKYLVNIDSRYVQSLEEEVKDLIFRTNQLYAQAVHYFGLAGTYNQECNRLNQEINNRRLVMENKV